MNITKKESWDDLKNSGDYLITKHHGTDENAGVVLKCICGDIISLSNTVHTFKSYDPLDIEPSILHTRDDKSLPNCHYFIREGKYIQG